MWRHFNALETIIIHVLLLFFVFFYLSTLFLTLIEVASPRRLRPQLFLSHDHQCHSAADWNYSFRSPHQTYLANFVSFIYHIWELGMLWSQNLSVTSPWYDFGFSVALAVSTSSTLLLDLYNQANAKYDGYAWTNGNCSAHLTKFFTIVTTLTSVLGRKVFFLR